MSEPSIKTTRPPSILEKVEDAIIAYLEAELPVWVNIEAWPENTNDYDFVNQKGVVLVHYTGSRFVGPGDQSTNQMRGMGWVLVLKTRSLRGEYGAYAVLEDLRRAIQGQSFEGGGPVRMVRDDLESERDGVWQWNVVITMPIPAVAKRHPRHAAPRPFTQSLAHQTSE